MKQAWRKLYIRKNCDVPTFCGVIELAYQEIWRIQKRHAEYLFAHFKEKHFTYYIHGVDEWHVGRRLYQRHFRRPEDIVHAYRQGKVFLRRTKRVTETWKRILAQSTGPERVRNMIGAFEKFVKDFHDVNYNYSIMPWWALEAWQHDFEERMSGLIRLRSMQSHYDVIMASLLKPWKPTAIARISRALRRGASAARLARQYQFLRSWTVVWHKPLTAGWVRSTAAIDAKKSMSLWSKQTILTRLRPGKRDRQFIVMAPYIAFFKDWRDDLRRQHAYDWEFLFIGIVRHFRVPYDDVGYLTLEEISQSLHEDRWPSAIVQGRKNGEFILTVSSQPSSIRVVAPIPHRYRMALTETETHRETFQVAGVAAQLGTASGMVRLVRTVHDIKKVEAGDILVTNTTHPNYLLAMKKAAAFVTDEGGIASHAAIVAREMKKPCIVGTKIATKVFRDGDQVEVDAGAGVVRKL